MALRTGEMTTEMRTTRMTTATPATVAMMNPTMTTTRDDDDDDDDDGSDGESENDTGNDDDSGDGLDDDESGEGSEDVGGDGGDDDDGDRDEPPPVGDDAESEDEPPPVDDNDGSEEDDGCATGGTNDGSTDLPHSAASAHPAPSSFGDHGGDDDDGDCDGPPSVGDDAESKDAPPSVDDDDGSEDGDDCATEGTNGGSVGLPNSATPVHPAPSSFCGVVYKGPVALPAHTDSRDSGVADDGEADDNDNDSDGAPLQCCDDDSADDGAVARSQPVTVRRRRRRISDSDNDDDSDSGGAHGCAVSADSAALSAQPDSASTASAASHAQPVYGYGIPGTGDHDDSDGADGAVAGGPPITSLLPIGMAVHVFTYGQRRPATITGHASNGDVEFKVFSTGVWRTWYETRPPSFFGIGQTTPPDEITGTADQPDVDAADGLTATAAASPQRVWRGAAPVTVLTNADVSRARRLQLRQHQRDQSHLTDSRGSRLTEAQQIALALRRSTGPLASSPGGAASDDTHASDSGATAPPAAQETEFDNGEPGLRNEESLAVAMALSLSIASTQPASTQPMPEEPMGDTASDAAQDSDDGTTDPPANPMLIFDDPGEDSDSDTSLTEMVAATAADECCPAPPRRLAR